MISSLGTSNAIFQDVGHALQVAFLVMSVEARQDAPMRMALLRMMEYTDHLTVSQANWYDALRGTESGTINFSGLTSTEIRAQCALITLSVKSKLPREEMWALQARYGQMEAEGEKSKQRFAFSAERITALKGLSDWLSPSFPGMAPLALDCIVAKVYANHKKTAISFRALAKSFGENHMTYARAFPKIKKYLRDFELRGAERLRAHFEAEGIIAPQKESA